MKNNPQTFVSFPRGSKTLESQSSIEEVKDVMGHPCEEWNDGTEACLSYFFPTHDLEFHFKVILPNNRTELCQVEIGSHFKLGKEIQYDVLASAQNGGHVVVEEGLSREEATRSMADRNHKRGLATHWISRKIK